MDFGGVRVETGQGGLLGVPVTSDGLVTGVFECRQWWVDYWGSLSAVTWCLNQPHAACGQSDYSEAWRSHRPCC